MPGRPKEADVGHYNNCLVDKPDVKGMMRFMRVVRFLLLFGSMCLLLAIASFFLGQDAPVTPQNQTLSALLAHYGDAPPPLDAQTRLSGCHVSGPLPDHDCTPGAIFTDATVERICTPGYSRSVRSVSTTLKKKIYAAYDITYPQPTGSYELDHLIALELGGNNESANLFPEAASPAPGFREKDVVEDYLHQEVCMGRISLAAAQHQIADNWVAVYQTLAPSTITEIRNRFRGWAD